MYNTDGVIEHAETTWIAGTALDMSYYWLGRIKG